MVKQILSPIYVCSFTVVFVLALIGHLMYGGCQTTKYHYMCQAYWMPKNLPGFMVRFKYDERIFIILNPPKDYSGTWSCWDEKGDKIKDIEYINGQMHGLCLTYYIGGRLHWMVNKVNCKNEGLLKSFF